MASRMLQRPCCANQPCRQHRYQRHNGRILTTADEDAILAALEAKTPVRALAQQYGVGRNAIPRAAKRAQTRRAVMPAAVLANCDACGTLLRQTGGAWTAPLGGTCNPGRAEHQPATDSIRRKEW